MEFFEDRGHEIVESSDLVSDDPSVLFTTAGMQQFKPYYRKGESPYGSRATSCQKCLRTSDIEEVGDQDHLTFMEMLGNFSFGYPGGDSYFKEESIKWAYEFLTEECDLEPDRLWFTYYEGSEDIPTDEETPEMWREMGVPEERILGFKEENFWGPTGDEGPCGPTAEIHYDLTGDTCGSDCKPNDECGRFVEVWNLVFNQYYQDEEGNYEPLEQKGIDTGMGLERLALICQREESIFQTDLFQPIIEEIEVVAGNYEDNPEPYRIIADHIRASIFLAEEGVTPSNKEEGYILRRLLRRAIRFKKVLGIEEEDFLSQLAEKVIELYQVSYQFNNQEEIINIIQEESEKFEEALDRGLNKLKEILQNKEEARLTGEEAFDLYQSYGFPLELTEELGEEQGFEVDSEGFQEKFEEHKKVSRAGAERKFSGVGIDKIDDEQEEMKAKKLHSTTHLLHQALRTVLGDHVVQKGSDITPERLRFDFSHPESLTQEEIEQVEDLINKKIEEDLEVTSEEMDYDKAIEEGALHLPGHDYPSEVTVYSMGDFSKELCRGPHVERTGVLGEFEITKEQSSSAGVRRIKAVLK